MIRTNAVLRAAALGLVCAVLPGARADEPTESVRFNRDIRPLLAANCLSCHGPDAKHRRADLQLDDRDSALSVHDGARAIVPGDRAASALWQRVTATDPAERMPPPEAKKTLSETEVALLGRWIDEGAPYEGHWAFIAPRRPAVPDVAPQSAGAARARNAIDRFVLARLEREALSLSPEADRETLIRRVTFDLTGLPPTLEEIDAFLADDRTDAYERVVDRLLESPRYGERMALMWMDAARYGDTSVHHADGPRDMWPWRDWVIRAYNDNMPFDRFSIEQLAGDLLPEPTPAQLIATGFNRNHGTSDEGGAIDEEYRVEYMVDRVKTTSTVWLGMTLECGQCHEHKFDPLPQKEYYQFYAFFNQTDERGMQTRNGNAEPLVPVPNPEAAALVPGLREEIAALDARLADRERGAGPDAARWLAEAAGGDQSLALPARPLVHCPLDESDGRAVQDLAAEGRRGKLEGKTSWAPGEGKHGGALRLDGGNFVDVGDVASFERTDRFSLGAWIRLDEKMSAAAVARMDDGASHRGWDLYLNNGRPAVHLINTWPSNAIKVIAKRELTPGEWHHVFMTYDGSSRAAGITIYIDGEASEWDIEQDRLSESMRASVPLYIGSRKPGSRFKGLIDDVRVYERALSAIEVAALAGKDLLRPILALSEAERTDEQRRTLVSFYLENHDAAYGELREERARATARIAELGRPISTVMVMREMADPRKTYVLERGHYASPRKDDVIAPGTPSFLPPMPDDAPRNRLGMARWLFQPDHPLTARVAVNRYWQMLFGTGLVATAEDFGTQGAWPSHPELLDWLAVDFAASGWNVKRALRRMVTSATYRQSARVTPELAARDPQNRLLARGPRFRLQGEFVRDAVLAASGLFVGDVGGPGDKPYQPPGLWNEVSLDGNVRFVQDHGEKLYRRSMYIYWKRSAPMPVMMLFDAPTREKCTIRRQRTNTPLQALVVMNDPQFVEAARALAERAMREGGATPDERVTFMYRLATSRRPSAAAVARLVAAQERELTAFRGDPERAAKLLAIGESKRDEALDAAEHAAWTLVASTILNLDAALTR